MANPNRIPDGRMTNFAQNQIKKSSKYVNLGNLSLFGDIEPEAGMTFFSIPVRVGGEWNQNNYARALKNGLRPVKASRYPHCKLPDDVYYPEGMRPSNDVIEIGGHMLMEAPTHEVEAKRASYNQITQDAEAQITYADDGSSAQFGIVGHRYR